MSKLAQGQTRAPIPDVSPLSNREKWDVVSHNNHFQTALERMWPICISQYDRTRSHLYIQINSVEKHWNMLQLSGQP